VYEIVTPKPCENTVWIDPFQKWKICFASGAVAIGEIPGIEICRNMSSVRSVLPVVDLSIWEVRGHFEVYVFTGSSSFAESLCG